MVLQSLIKRYPVYIFPAILCVVLLLLTSARISGTSIGFFNNILFGNNYHDKNLLVNKPLGVRSDEWEVNTPLTISQVHNDLPRVNKDIGHGQDMSIVLDVPYKDWSSLFKPQNWSFFLLPVEYAFAFKWWSLAFLLMLGCYIFCLRILPRQYLLSSLLSIFLFLSPFVQWWYQSSTILPIAYGLLIASIGTMLFNHSLRGKKYIATLVLLFYILCCFEFVLYVPFILSVALVVGSFIIGDTLNTVVKTKDYVFIRRRLLHSAAVLLMAVAILALFLSTRLTVVQAISNSVYPGHRIEQSGHFDIRMFGGGFYNIQLQNLSRALHLPPGSNQSEASNFVLIAPFLLLSLLYIVASHQKKRSNMMDWRIIALLLIFLVVLVRLFVPFSEFIFNFIHLNRIPHDRIIIALGMINIMLLVISIQYLQKYKKTTPTYITYSSIFLAFIVPFLLGVFIRNSYIGYLGNSMKITLISLTMGLSIYLFIYKRFVFAMLLLVGFSFISVAKVNPLYRGLSPVINSDLSHNLQEVGDTKGNWLVSNDVIFENVTIANGLHSISGVYAYPQPKLWATLKKNPRDEDIYNRYAHVFFSAQIVSKNDHPHGAYLNPPALDAFQINVDPCSDYLKQVNVHYIVTSSNLSNFTCLKEIKNIPYPNLNFKIYQIDT